MMWTLLLIVHGLLAVALLGAITHQAMSVWLPAKKPATNFPARFRAVAGASYVNAIIVLYVCTFVLGAAIYPEYRVNIRVVIEQMEAWAENGAFELKEHFAAVGMAMLPAYWYFWRQPPDQHGRTRAALTALLAFIVWWNFLVGHVLNNMRGFGA
jgi:hypothetical protein